MTKILDDLDIERIVRSHAALLQEVKNYRAKVAKEYDINLTRYLDELINRAEVNL